MINPYIPAVPGTVIGRPQQSIQIPQKRQELKIPEMDLKRAINFYADYSGCGYWRMIWPEQILTAYQHMIVHGTTIMCFDENWYASAETIRIQRQATPHQLKFIKHLKQLSQKHNFKLVYEIDDIVFHEDIPHYNKFRSAFTDPQIRQSAQEIMNLCDEMTVTCDYMKDYYAAKTNHKQITVIPNYMPKFWMGHCYNEKEVAKNFERNRKRPRILYPGSGAHFDVDNRTKQQDDFGHVLDAVIKTRKKFKWVFFGAYPLSLKPYIQSGEMEFHQWTHLWAYPETVVNLKPNVLVAPLHDNTFNRAKSDLKYIEACALGIPAVCQDLDTYQNAPFRFKTGDEMIDQINAVTKDKSTYMKIGRAGQQIANGRWLESDNNIAKYKELYSLPYGHSDRIHLNKQNGI